jgi:hypothetical protein
MQFGQTFFILNSANSGRQERERERGRKMARRGTEVDEQIVFFN